MSTRSIGLDDELYPYLLDVSLRESPLLAELRAETARLPEARMQIAPEQGQFMALLARLAGARRYLEIGTFTGYSTLAIAQALPSDGHVVACDLSREWTDIARRYWRRAGVEERIDLRLGPATETLQALRDDPATQPFDLAFIDADKTGYVDYYERCLELVRPNGLILVDNTLWYGRVAAPEVKDESTEAIRHFNQYVADDDRVDLALAPVADGLTFCRKRAA